MSDQLDFITSQNTTRATYFADVLLPFPLYKPFTYRIPIDLESNVKIGTRVIVQFGKKKIYTAIVYSLHKNPPKAYQAKYILEVMDHTPIVDPLHLRFWQWIADYYCCPIGTVMEAALPSNLKLESETKIQLMPHVSYQETELDDREYLVIEALEVQAELTISDLEEILNRKQVFPIIRSLHEKGLITTSEDLQQAYKPLIKTFVACQVDLEQPDERKEAFDQVKNAPKQTDLLLAYQLLHKEQKHIEKKELLEKANVSDQVLNSLVQKNLLTTYEKAIDRVSWEEPIRMNFELNEEQDQALDAIKNYFKEKNAVLLHGVTGSGKTHVYIRLLEATIEQGYQALYLVPEIALTTQLIKRLRNYFGNDIGIYHSKFNPNERVEIWNKVRAGEYKIVMGVRSAMFLPFPNLGLIVIDEEHETTFKQMDPAPRYHARDSAIYLSTLFNAKVLMGTGTPSMESYFNAKSGKYGLVKLTERYGNLLQPKIKLANLAEEYQKNKMRSHFSSTLFHEMSTHLHQNHQVILFQNRRGYSPFIQCNGCGWVPQCQNCDISLTYHKFYKEIRCHICSYKEELPTNCRACGSNDLNMKGFGTEKIEDELITLLPEYTAIRLDQDTTKRKNAFQKIINQFEQKEARILVGTQMVTKGLDFEDVKLVGILNADQMLKFPDFRANERSFHLMLQVSGRAGRKHERGIVTIQTFIPQHFLFKYLINNDYEGFYKEELMERNKFKYPPYYRLIKLTLRDQSLDTVSDGGKFLTNRLKKLFGDQVLGPEIPAVLRVKNLYINNILIKFKRNDPQLQQAKALMMEEIDQFRTEKNFKSIRITIDVDPY